MVGGALEERHGAKLNRTAGLQALPVFSADRKDRQFAESPDLARRGLRQHREILDRGRERRFAAGQVDMHFVIVALEGRILHGADGDNRALLPVAFHIKRDELLEGG
jgi:hypothetical protein